MMERDMRPIPQDTGTLLDQLEELYPPRCRRPDESEREHERYAGKVDLIAELKARFNR
jgi:hypothetical protein